MLQTTQFGKLKKNRELIDESWRRKRICRWMELSPNAENKNQKINVKNPCCLAGIFWWSEIQSLSINPFFCTFSGTRKCVTNPESERLGFLLSFLKQRDLQSCEKYLNQKTKPIFDNSPLPLSTMKWLIF